jgi:hypothetical protein
MDEIEEIQNQDHERSGKVELPEPTSERELLAQRKLEDMREATRQFREVRRAWRNAS